MTKIEIYQDSKGEEAPEKIIRLKLVRNDNRSVTLIAVNEFGTPITAGCLATISSEGIALYSSVNPEIGFHLDGDGRILVHKR